MRGLVVSGIGSRNDQFGTPNAEIWAQRGNLYIAMVFKVSTDGPTGDSPKNVLQAMTTSLDDIAKALED